jgi:hypothetical protein
VNICIYMNIYIYIYNSVTIYPSCSVSCKLKMNVDKCKYKSSIKEENFGKIVNFVINMHEFGSISISFPHTKSTGTVTTMCIFSLLPW